MPDWRTLLANHRALLAYYALTRCVACWAPHTRLCMLTRAPRRSAMLALPMAAMSLLLNRELGMAVRALSPATVEVARTPDAQSARRRSRSA